jgi:glycosyltransferase involved in cell wall biosynthesis
MRERRLDEIDVLLVRLASTAGLKEADEALSRSLRRAGAEVAVVTSEPPEEVPTMMLTDLLWARAARRAALGLCDSRTGARPRAVIYSTTTAALMWPYPGAIRFDAPAAANRPGRHGLWQRPLERRRLREASLLLPWSEGGLTEACAAVPSCADRALVVPAPIDLAPENPTAGSAGAATGAVGDARHGAGRDIAAVTYAANPHKKGFDRVLAAWRRVRKGTSERLVVAGVTPQRLRGAGFEFADEELQVVGPLAPSDYRRLLRRARVFVCAPRREDYGLAQLEALAEGCQLVSTPAPGPYVALPIAHQLDPRLVSEDLGSALRAALEAPRPDYAERAAELVEAYGTAAVDRVVAEQLLPRLMRGSMAGG